MFKWLVFLSIVGALAAFPTSNGPAAFGPRSKEEVDELKDFLYKTKEERQMTLEEAMKLNPTASPWENSGKYQGDIVLHDEEVEEMVAEYSGNVTDIRTGLRDPRHRWPGGQIVYQIAGNTFTQAQLNMIQQGLNFFHERTCTRWIPRTNQRDYVLITGRQDGCYATVGYWQNYGAHTLNLANGCFHLMIVIHEMLHSAGFHHMHQTYNRYDWIWINWQNVQRGMEHNFHVFSSQVVNMLGLPYEYASNQHYGPTAFSVNGQPTIGARFHTNEMGQLNFISGWDIWRLARLYNCPGAWRVNVRLEDANKPYDDEFKRMMDEAAEEELRERAEMLNMVLAKNVSDKEDTFDHALIIQAHDLDNDEQRVGIVDVVDNVLGDNEFQNDDVNDLKVNVVDG